MAERIIIDQTEVEQQIQDNRDGDNVVTWNWDNADVNDINITEDELSDIEAIEVNINNSELNNFNLLNASITGLIANSQINDSSLTADIFTEVIFRGTTLTNVDLTHTTHDGSRFENSQINHSELSDATFDASSFRDTTLDHVVLANATFNASTFRNTTFTNVELYNTTHNNSRFANSQITDSDISDSTFNAGTFTHTTLNNVNLSNCRFSNHTFFEHTTLTDVNLTGCIFENVRFDGNTTLNNCYWRTSAPRDPPRGYIITTEFINFVITNGFGASISETVDSFNATEENGPQIEEQPLQPIRPAVQPIQHQGLAYEVHNAFDNLLPSHPELPTDKRRDYLKLIKMGPTYTSEKRLIKYIKKLFQKNIPRLFDEPDSSILLSKFNSLMENKFPGTPGSMTMSKPEISLIGKSVYFAFKQGNEFKRDYIANFVNDSCHAYDGSGPAAYSCVKGIKERFVLGIAGTVEILCADRPCDEKYEILNNFFKQNINIKGKIADYVSAWFTDNAEFVKDGETDDIKTRLREFLLTKYPYNGEDIDIYIGEIELASPDFIDFRGGRKSIKSRKSRKSRNSGSRKYKKGKHTKRRVTKKCNKRHKRTIKR